MSSHAGNLSVRLGDRLLITRTGAMLGRLRPEDLVETGIEADDPMTPLASSEIAVHRAVYTHTDAQAVVHTHPTHALALSLKTDEIVPVDAEGAHLLGRVPVVDGRGGLGSDDSARRVSGVLAGCRACLVRGHGLFAAGRSLEEAYRWTSALEASARVLYLVRGLAVGTEGAGGPCDGSVEW